MIEYSNFLGKKIWISTIDNRSITGVLLEITPDQLRIKMHNHIENVFKSSVLRISDKVFPNRATHFWEE